MLRHFFVLLASLMAIGCGSGEGVPAEDATHVVDSSASPTSEGETQDVEIEDVAAFFARFKSTVRANDAEAVANMAAFPLAGMTREQFLDESYTATFGEGGFRDRLLAASPAALVDQGEGRYSFSANVTGDCGAEEFDCESAAVFYFARNAEGHWRLVDILYAG